MTRLVYSIFFVVIPLMIVIFEAFQRGIEGVGVGVDIFILYFVGRVKVVLVIGIVAVDLFMIGAVVLVAELLIGSVVG